MIWRNPKRQLRETNPKGETSQPEYVWETCTITFYITEALVNLESCKINF